MVLKRLDCGALFHGLKTVLGSEPGKPDSIISEAADLGGDCGRLGNICTFYFRTAPELWLCGLRVVSFPIVRCKITQEYRFWCQSFRHQRCFNTDN